MKIAIAQMPVTTEKEENLKSACRYIHEAATAGASLVILPEMFNCPYTSRYFRDFAEPEGGHSWQTISRQAAQERVCVVAGSMPELSGERIYNTSWVFDREGKQIARHRKTHLFDIQVEGGQHFRESDTFAAGSDVTIFSVDGVTMGLCICFDFRFPELARLLTLEGAQVIVVPAAFNMTTGPMHWELMFRQRAVDNQVFTIGAAPARDEKADYVSYGNSILCSPWGKVLTRAEGEPQLLLAELDLTQVQAVREQLPLLKARREDVYALTKAGGRHCNKSSG